MTQRIFDIENKKDMADLWGILPDEANKIEKYPDKVISPIAGFCAPSIPMISRSLIKINWHDKTEITRPVNYEDMIGCVGFFGNKGSEHILSILTGVDTDFAEPWFKDVDDSHWESFRPAKKSELKFYGDEDD